MRIRWGGGGLKKWAKICQPWPLRVLRDISSQIRRGRNGLSPFSRMLKINVERGPTKSGRGEVELEVMTRREGFWVE